MKRDKKSTGVPRAPEKSSKMLALSQIGAGKSAISIPQIKTKKAPIHKELLVLPDYDLARSSFCRGSTVLRFGKVHAFAEVLPDYDLARSSFCRGPTGLRFGKVHAFAEVLPDYDLARSSFCRSNWARAVFRSSLSKGPPMIFCK